MKRKYISEFAIIMNLTHTLVVQQDDLSTVSKLNYFSKSHPCHIYFICRRPRILINPIGFLCSEETVTFNFKKQHQNNFEDFSVNIPNRFGSTNLQLESDYPFNRFKFYVDDKIFWEGKSALLLNLFSSLGLSYTDYLDLEVLYIGQSYGVAGARTAPDRLQSHSTLQGIYAEAISRNPDYEIWLILTSFEELLLTTMDGSLKATEEEQSLDSKRLLSVTDTLHNGGLQEQQVINFTEAALIRYFSPQYNKEYKDTFPNPAHKTYKKCYDLDINSVGIEVKTENIFSRLYSSEIEKKWVHIKTFFLHSREERKEMFDFG